MLFNMPILAYSRNGMEGLADMKGESVAAVFAALANETRLRCLNLVVHNRDVCVCEAVAALGISQPAASKAMGTLKAAGLVAARRDANWTHYSLQRPLPAWLRKIVNATTSELNSRQPYLQDLNRFAELELREDEQLAS
jgi:DNA-binding transcriptional ArsR family regulator